MRFGNNCTLALRLLDVETGNVERSAVDSQPCATENYPSMISKLVYSLSFETGIGEEALKESMKPPPPPPKPGKPMSKGERSFWFGLGALALTGVLVGGAVSTNNEGAQIALGMGASMSGLAGFALTMAGIQEW